MLMLRPVCPRAAMGTCTKPAPRLLNARKPLPMGRGFRMCTTESSAICSRDVLLRDGVAGARGRTPATIGDSAGVCSRGLGEAKTFCMQLRKTYIVCGMNTNVEL